MNKKSLEVKLKKAKAHEAAMLKIAQQLDKEDEKINRKVETAYAKFYAAEEQTEDILEKLVYANIPEELTITLSHKEMCDIVRNNSKFAKRFKEKS